MNENSSLKSVFSIVTDGASEADRPIDGNLVVGVAVELVVVAQV